MEKGWVKAYGTNRLYQANIIKEMLADHEINSVIINKQDSSYKFGEIEIYTRQSDVIRAKHLINKIEL